MYSFIFFFFQAEDGIRDLTVTGVQTCALPIFRDYPGARGDLRAQAADAQRARDPVDVPQDPAAGTRGRAEPEGPGALVRGDPEERRVGKECRSRWSP